MTSDDYFRGPSGTRYTYADIADRIRREAPQTLGKHIFVQLEAIGLLEEMQNGTTPCGLPFTFAEAAPSPLLVPSGSPLLAGKLYLQLYHGRTDPEQQMDDWGFTGPTFGPLSCVVQTYFTTVRLHGEPYQELWLEQCDDMIVWNGSYYGDMSIFIATGNEHG
jgi:hypothetical protein